MYYCSYASVSEKVQNILKSCKSINNDINDDTSDYVDKYIELINKTNEITSVFVYNKTLPSYNDDIGLGAQDLLMKYSILLANINDKYLNMDYNDILIYSSIINAQVNILNTFINLI